MTVNSRIIKTFLEWSPEATDVPLMNGLRVQILPTIEDLSKARKHQFAAFIMMEQLLVVWDDEAMNLIPRAKAIENELMELVWQTGEEEEEAAEEGGKKGPAVVTTELNEETGEYESKRPLNIMNAVLVSFTLTLITIMLGAGFRQIAQEIAVDHGWLRLCFLVLIPVQIFFTLVCSAFWCDFYYFVDQDAVFRPSYRRLHRAVHWPYQTDARKLKILLRVAPSPHRKRYFTARDDSMPCIQGRSSIGHRTHRQIHQASYINI
jgi:hypothetical protein